MEIKFSYEQLTNMKKKIDLVYKNIDKDTRDIKQFECLFFKVVNELFIIKACFDCGMVTHSNQTVDQVKKQLIKKNSIFRNIFEEGDNYEFNLSNEIIEKLKIIVFSYSYTDIDFDLIGKLYQKYINVSDKKKYGQYYTDELIIDEILNNLGIHENNVQLFTSKYLDPACGTGSFLVRIANKIIRTGLQKKISPKKIIYSIKNIYGFDINDFAVYIAKSNILVQLLPIITKNNNRITLNIYVTNALLNLSTNQEIDENLTVTNIKQRRGEFLHGFDYILGNPPYFKAKNLDYQQKIYFQAILSGQQNTYSLFLFLSIRLLKEGGSFGVIIPESIKSGQYFRALREYIFETCTISNIVSFDCRKTNFEHALQGVLILCAYKGCRDDSSSYINIQNVTNKHSLYKKEATNFNVAYEDVVRYVRDYPIILACKSKEQYKLFNKLYENCNYINDEIIGYRAHTGKLVWNQVKEYLSDDHNNAKIIVWSNNIKQYKYEITGDKNQKNTYGIYENKLKKLISEGECIILRRTSVKEQKNRINAAYFDSDDEYYLENHVNYIKKFSCHSKVSYLYLLAILNSELINFVISQITGNNQISVTELNLLPIKISKDIKEIEHLVEQINNQDENKESLKAHIEGLIISTYSQSVKDQIIVG